MARTTGFYGNTQITFHLGFLLRSQ